MAYMKHRGDWTGLDTMYSGKDELGKQFVIQKTQLTMTDAGAKGVPILAKEHERDKKRPDRIELPD
jgi:hypothetical protein